MITQLQHRLKTNVGIRWRWCDKISASELNWKIINDQQRYKELNKYSRGNKSNEQWVWARRQTCNKCREKREQRNNFIWRSIVPRLNRSDTSRRIETGGQKTWVILQIQAISLIKGQNIQVRHCDIQRIVRTVIVWELAGYNLDGRDGTGEYHWLGQDNMIPPSLLSTLAPRHQVVTVWLHCTMSQVLIIMLMTMATGLPLPSNKII